MFSKIKGIFNIKNNIVFIILIAGAVINDMILRALTVGRPFYWKPIVTTIAMITIVSSIIFIFNHKIRNKFFITLSIYLGVLNGVNYLYYKYYKSYLSFSLLNQLSQVGGVSDSVSETLDIKVLIFLIAPIVLIVAIKMLRKSGFFTLEENKAKKIDFVRAATVGIALLVCVSMTLTGTDWSRITKQWNRPYLVEQLGLYPFSVADSAKCFSGNNISNYEPEEAFEILNHYLEGKLNAKDTNNKYSDVLQGRDVYVIHYESAQSFAMDLEFEDGPVTPFLNKLANGGLYFNNFHTQQSSGTSSDTEFTFNTSLLPINNGTVFLTHFDREYVTLPKMLKDEGYYTFSMHGNNSDMWNRTVMHKSLRYDDLIFEDDYELDEVIGLGISDKSFFRQSIEKIKQIKEETQQPLMATLITLTNHYPFTDVDKYGEFNVGHLEGTKIGNYLKSLHYADQALQSFVEGMDEAGMLDNAVIVLYGDHHAKILKEDFNRLYNYDVATETKLNKKDEGYFSISGSNYKNLKRTPFIIWTKDETIKPEVVELPTGMVDALPTISNMLGIFNPYQLGQDMVSAKDNMIVFPNGDWLNSEVFYQDSSSKLYNIADNSYAKVRDDGSINIKKSNDNNEDSAKDDEIIIKLASIVQESTKSVEDMIELSNGIIQHDLIRNYIKFLAKDGTVKFNYENFVN